MRCSESVVSDRFQGFRRPKSKFVRLPNSFIEQELSRIESLAELKIILYVMRHTWGFNEYHMWKKFTIDEFMHGRKTQNGERRFDEGTGLSDYGVKDGLAKAIEHGYLLVKTDSKDKARIKKYYCLKIIELDPPKEVEEESE